MSSVAQSYLTLRDTMDWSPPGSSARGISQQEHWSVTPWTVARQAPPSVGFPSKNTGVGCHFLLQGIYRTQGSNLNLCVSCTGKRILYHEVPPGKPSQINTVNKSPLFFTPLPRRENKLARNSVRKFPLKKKKGYRIYIVLEGEKESPHLLSCKESQPHITTSCLQRPQEPAAA